MFVAWSGLSLLWSIQGDRSWSYLNRDLALLGFAVSGMVLGAVVPRSLQVVAGGLAGLLAVLVVWALAAKVVPALGPDVSRNARLRSPVGYWNALAVLADLALVLGLWLAARRDRAPAVRAGGVVLAYASAVVTVLTFSRGGIAIGALTLVAWLLLGGAVLETVVALAVAVPLAAAVCGWAFTRSALVDAGGSQAERAHDGRLFGALLLAGAAVAFAACLLPARAEVRHPVGPERRRAWARGALVGGIAAGVLALGVLVARGGGPASWAHARVDEFATPTPVIEGPGRLSAGSSNYRWTWWRQAWDTFVDEPVKGAGAGSFDLAHRVFRTAYSPPAREPHDLPLQVLSETGLVGFGLLMGAFAAAALAIAGGLRRLRGEQQAAAAALAACLVAYGLHLLVDTGWDYIAVSGPAFFLLGVLAAGGPAAGGPRRLLPALAALALSGAAVASLATPWLAERRIDAAFAAIDRKDYAAAAAEGKRAHALNPLSLDALTTWASAELLRKRPRQALQLYVDKVDLQPKNPETWYDLGSFEAVVLHDCGLGYRYLNRSYTLDPFGPAGQRGGLLDQTRASVNRDHRRCDRPLRGY